MGPYRCGSGKTASSRFSFVCFALARECLTLVRASLRMHVPSTVGEQGFALLFLHPSFSFLSLILGPFHVGDRGF
jgi:hypothetical protein